MQHPPTYRRPYVATLAVGLLAASTTISAAPLDNPPVLDTTAPSINTATLPALSYDTRRPALIPQFQDSAPPIENIPVPIEVSDTVDGNSATFSFSPEAEIGPLTPGRYILDWRATDLGFNETTASQTLDVKPRINLGPNQTAGEGGTALVTAYLSGPLPAAAGDFPITVPYTVSGTASGADHDAVNGSFTFANATQTSASINIHITSDGVNDAGETVIITIDDSAPLWPAQMIQGHTSSHEVLISESNHAPLAQLSASQNGKQTRAVITGDGPVTVTAADYDANGDGVNHDWSASDNALTPLTGTTGSSFEFDPQGLTPGFYTVRLTVSDANGGSSAYELLLAVLAQTPNLSSATDLDDDGTKDADEGLVDSDNDGIPDYLDANTNPALMQGFEPYVFDADVRRSQTLINDSITLTWEFSADGATPASNLIVYPLMIATRPGLSLNLGPTAFAAGKAYARLSTAQAEALRNAEVADGLASSDGQVLDLEITGLQQAGAGADIIVPQTAGIPPSQDGTLRFMVFSRDRVWEAFSSDVNNQIATDLKGNDFYCPDFADIDAANPYQGALVQGQECLLIRVQDGGPNDYDGAANGVIHFMGGIFIATDSTADQSDADSGTFTGSTSTSSETLGKLNLGTGDGGGALNWIMVLGLVLGHWLLRRPQYTLIPPKR
ncbi:hypothetical protein Tel_02305 [Candidatus Tenderia electrophaga]|jgi:hypothetical protein|uniref:Calx-beta domain-containing protein n=1 Tax=Candidatus Tenderia electrophaga TaxID=1748243 RepID=A0A0S2TAC5_9GAMM|nr:hypothetical protein Tel_02305 [Candidatus Tenderia electrophaga]